VSSLPSKFFFVLRFAGHQLVTLCKHQSNQYLDTVQPLEILENIPPATTIKCAKSSSRLEGEAQSGLIERKGT